MFPALVAGEVVTISLSNKFDLTEGCNIEDVYSRLKQDAGMPSQTLTLRQAELYDAWALTYVYNGRTYVTSSAKMYLIVE